MKRLLLSTAAKNSLPGGGFVFRINWRSDSLLIRRLQPENGAANDRCTLLHL
jgi:hypothetical protein